MDFRFCLKVSACSSSEKSAICILKSEIAGLLHSIIYAYAKGKDQLWGAIGPQGPDSSLSGHSWESTFTLLYDCACGKGPANGGVSGSSACVRAGDCGIRLEAFPGTHDRDGHRHGDASARARQLHDDADANAVQRRGS